MCIDGRGSAASVATAYETPCAYLPVWCLPMCMLFGWGQEAEQQESV